MKTATALTLLAIGAILAFAVTANTSVFNLNVAGWVLMATGLVGVLIPRRGYGWVRRRLVLPHGARRRAITVAAGANYPPYVKRNPGTSAMQAGLATVPNIGPDSAAEQTIGMDGPIPADAEVIEEVYDE
jgi:hypothetical protein